MTFAQVRKLMKHAALEPHGLPARLVYAYILEQGEGQYPVRFLCTELGISYVTVQSAIQELLTSGLLSELSPSSGPRAATLKAKEIS